MGKVMRMAGGSRGAVLGPLRTLFNVGAVGGMTDGQLLERFLARREGEAEAAFAALVAAHGPMVWDVCRGLLADPHAAEDAFQATFLVLVRKAGSIRRRDAVGPWLHGVARRIAGRAQAVAARRRIREVEERVMTAGPGPDPIRREQLEAMHEEVDRLAEKYRAPLVLCYLEGRTHAEAARLLRCPVGTVSVRLSRARDLLRARLTRRGVALSAAVAGATLGRAGAASAMPAGLADSTIRAAMHLAAGQAMAAGTVPALVAQLVGGEMKAMMVTKSLWVAAGLLATGSVAVGIGLIAAEGAAGLTDPARGPAAVAPGQGQAQPADPMMARARSMQNLKLIGLAMHNYAARHNRAFPGAAIYKDGKPMLSWRVAILPYLDQKDLYNKFHLDEPWDSPHNKALLDQMPEVYAPVIPVDKPEPATYYQVYAGPGALFNGETGTKLDDIKDGTGMTIMVIEGAKPVPWTKPEELPFDVDKPLPEVGGQQPDGACVGMADGSARFIGRQVDLNIFKALVTPSGGENVTGDRF